MFKSNLRPSTKSSTSASSGRPARSSDESYDSYETYQSENTAPTSASASTLASIKDDMPPLYRCQPAHEYDICPSTSCCPRSSADTFDSTLTSDEGLPTEGADANASYNDNQDIPRLPVYRHYIVDPNVRPSSPQDFAKLFPSMNRLSIRHDDFTPDGNLNLRVDTVVPGRRRLSMQLFHLRMHDLAQRDFSLRRYCRDSGREVCNSTREYHEAPAPHHNHAGAEHDRPNLQRSMSSAIKTLGGGRKGLTRINTENSNSSTTSQGPSKRLQTSHSHHHEGDNVFTDCPPGFDDGDTFKQYRRSRALPTNTIKLEFSNYARVNVSRRGSRSSKRYNFEWWGHRYHWKRVIDKNLGSVSFHLYRNDRDHDSGSAIAHIVPENRDPNQIAVDEEAGGWVPPCHMWISDQGVLDAATDVADVIVATGLSALVDDCIKARWQVRGGKKIRRFSVPLTSKTVDVGYVGPRTLVQNLFHRQPSGTLCV